MRETIISADIDASRLDGCMRRVQAGPIATEMTQMPLLVNETIFLLFGNFVVDKLGNNAKVENERVPAASIFPVESFLELSAGSKNSIHREVTRRRRWVEPALIIFSEWIEEIVGAVNPLTHCFG